MTYENMMVGWCCGVPLVIFLIGACVLIDEKLSWRRHRKRADKMLSLPILSMSGENEDLYAADLLARRRWEER